MIRILIIEDEQSAYANLTYILNQLDDEFVVVDWLQSVEQSIAWFESNEDPGAKSTLRRRKRKKEEEEKKPGCGQDLA